MKRSLKTNAIVLKRININEADRLVTIFSEASGKLTVKAKAVRRPLSKLAGGLEPLYLSQFHLVQGNSIYTVAEAVPIKVYPKIHRGLKRLELAFFCAEAVNRLTEEGTPHRAIFDLLVQSLDFIETQALAPPEPWRRRIVAGWFLLNFLSAEGITPELKNCLFCRQPIEEGAILWSHAQGGLLHEQHAGVDQARLAEDSPRSGGAGGESRRAASKLEPNLVKLFRLLLGSDPAILTKVKVDERFADRFFQIIYDFFRWQTKIELRTFKQIDS